MREGTSDRVGDPRRGGGWNARGAQASGRYQAPVQPFMQSNGEYGGGPWDRQAAIQPYYTPREGDPVLRQIRDDWQGDALYGVNSIRAVLAAKRRTIYGLYHQQGEAALAS